MGLRMSVGLAQSQWVGNRAFLHPKRLPLEILENEALYDLVPCGLNWSTKVWFDFEYFPLVESHRETVPLMNTLKFILAKMCL